MRHVPRILALGESRAAENARNRRRSPLLSASRSIQDRRVRYRFELFSVSLWEKRR